MKQPGERSARLLLALGHSDEAVLRNLISSIGLARADAVRALELAHRNRNQEAWAVYR